MGCALLGCAAPASVAPPRVTPAVAPSAAASVPIRDAAAGRHLLSRFAFGPRPGEAEMVAAFGIERWLGEQLAPAPRENPALDAALAPYLGAAKAPAELVEGWLGASAFDEPMGGAALNREIKPYFKQHLAEVALLQITRQVLSERQLQEVMVQFWLNHFNVFAPKGLVRVLGADYIERALRPNALGRFEDLLVATARHPAMLIYLDNASSSRERPAPEDELDGSMSMSGAPEAKSPALRPAKPAKREGLNENYARELLELHTLGRDGGYTQDDVIATARILTGWGIVRRARRDERPLAFVFRKKKHDSDEKRVLGETFPAGHGEDEGLRLLHVLAAHPSTARHLAYKLCAYFVADEPPAECLHATERAFRESGGELKATLWALAHTESFWAPALRAAKLKTPLEFVVSALRAVGGKPDGTVELARSLRRLGEPMLEESVPVGYADASPMWLSESGLLARMQFATALAFGKLPGVSADVTALLPASSEGELLRLGNQRLLGNDASPSTLAAVQSGLAGVEADGTRRALAVAWFIGSPEFQRQ